MRTTTHPAATTTYRRSLPLLALTLASAIVLALPAAAQPAGPSDELGPQQPPVPDPQVVLEASPHCDPDAHVSYQVTILDGFPDRPYTVQVEWNEVDTANGGSVDGESGTIPTGEGDVELMAQVTYPLVITLDEQVLAAVVLDAAPTTVTVDCQEDGDGDPDPDDGPEDEPTPDPDIRRARPTFTG